MHFVCLCRSLQNRELLSSRLLEDQMKRPRKRDNKRRHKDVEPDDDNRPPRGSLQAMCRAVEDKVGGFIASSKSCQEENATLHPLHRRERGDWKYFMSLK